MTLIFLVAGITLLGSFLCSLFEATLYAITPSQVEILKSSGRFGALRLAALKGKVEDPIAAILTVNTLTHTVGSAWCGAMVGVEFGSAAVGVFAEDPGLASRIEDALAGSGDFERLGAKVATGRATPRDLVALADGLERVPGVRDLVAGSPLQ